MKDFNYSEYSYSMQRIGNLVMNKIGTRKDEEAWARIKKQYSDAEGLINKLQEQNREMLEALKAYHKNVFTNVDDKIKSLISKIEKEL